MVVTGTGQPVVAAAIAPSLAMIRLMPEISYAAVEGLLSDLTARLESALAKIEAQSEWQRGVVMLKANGDRIERVRYDGVLGYEERILPPVDYEIPPAGAQMDGAALEGQPSESETM